MSAFSVDTGRQTTPPPVDGVVHNRLVEQTMTLLLRHYPHFLYVINKKMHSLFCTLFSVSAMQKLLKSVKIWQSCSHMYTATFYEPRKKCRFRFFQVRCAHKSGDVLNFMIVACKISSWLKWSNNCENQLRLAKGIVKNKMSLFYGSLCIYDNGFVLSELIRIATFTLNF